MLPLNGGKAKSVNVVRLWNPYIGLLFRMSSIPQVFPAAFGAGSNTPYSGRMRNWRGQFFGEIVVLVVVSVFVVAIFVAGLLL